MNIIRLFFNSLDILFIFFHFLYILFLFFYFLIIFFYIIVILFLFIWVFRLTQSYYICFLYIFCISCCVLCISSTSADSPSLVDSVAAGPVGNSLVSSSSSLSLSSPSPSPSSKYSSLCYFKMYLISLYFYIHYFEIS